MSIEDRLPATWVPGPLSTQERCVLALEAERTLGMRALEVGHYYGASTSILLNSLPPTCALVTIDHHEGDVSTPAAPIAAFYENIAPYVGKRSLETFVCDMRVAFEGMAERLAEGRNPPPLWFDFVFYDADHTEQGVCDFWELVTPFLAQSCTLIYDDADWPSQAMLGELAKGDGFVSVRTQPIVRHMPADKTDPRTFTLEVMRRA